MIRTQLERYVKLLMTNGAEIYNNKSEDYTVSHVSICQVINGTTESPIPTTKLAIVSGLRLIWAMRLKEKSIPKDTPEPGSWLFEDSDFDQSLERGGKDGK